MNRLIPTGLLMLALSACGGSQDEESESTSSSSALETPFGSVEEVTSYLAKTGPFVRKIGAIQGELEKQGVGTTGGATATNLAREAVTAEADLKKILADFETLTAPPFLPPFIGTPRNSSC